MARPPKAIPENFQSEIIQYAKQGYSNNWIAAHCKDKGFDIDARVIGRFLDKQGVESKGKKTTFDKTYHSETSSNKEEVEPTPIVVDLENLFRRFNISDNLDNVESIIDATQKMTAQIFLLESAILHTRLEHHAKGEAKHPNEQFRGYRIASEVMKAAWGYEQTVNLAQAMRTLEAEGYEIQALRVIEEKQD